MIPVYEPYLTKESLKYAHDAIDSGWFSKGKYNQIVQEKLQELLGVKYVLPVCNGTAATHLIAKALKLKYPKISNVICANNVYVAAWNSFLFDQNYSLSYIDADIDTWNFDLKLIKPKPEDAILVVHNIGNIIDVPALSKQFPNPIVEDCCEGFMGKYSGFFAGTQALVSSVSFFGNKNITCGEGGAVLTNDQEIYEFVLKTHGQGQSAKRFVHDVLGYNYRLTNIQAAILCGQLDILDEIINKKTNLFLNYKKLLSHERIKLQLENENTVHSKWMFGIRIVGGNFERAEEFFKNNNVEVRPMFYPVTSHEHIRAGYVDVSVASLLNKECIILPSYPALTDEQQKYVAKIVLEYVNSI
jgi:perosamine synthetase